jgi:aquaporin-1
MTEYDESAGQPSPHGKKEQTYDASPSKVEMRMTSSEAEEKPIEDVDIFEPTLNPVDCVNRKELGRAMFAEFLGMTLFVFVGCGTAISSAALNDVDPTAASTVRLMPIAMAFGIGIVVLVYGVATFSGGHLNPAVTMLVLMMKKMSPHRALLYIMSQCCGAIFGAMILWFVSSDTGYGQPAFNLGANALADNLTTGQGLVLEIMGTLLLCLTVFFTAIRKAGPTDGPPDLAPLCIGLSVFLSHLVLIPFTGCGINPARTLGPAFVGWLVQGNDNNDAFFGPDAWIYYVGPVMGAAIATIIAHILGEHDDGTEHTFMDEERTVVSPQTSQTLKTVK